MTVLIAPSSRRESRERDHVEERKIEMRVAFRILGDLLQTSISQLRVSIFASDPLAALPQSLALCDCLVG